jgi:hypothetical protein
MNLNRNWDAQLKPGQYPWGKGEEIILSIDPSTHPTGTLPTSSQLTLFFGTNIGVDYVSDNGSCTITFSRDDQTAIEGTFVCSRMTSALSDKVVDATGDFSTTP